MCCVQSVTKDVHVHFGSYLYHFSLILEDLYHDRTVITIIPKLITMQINFKQILGIGTYTLIYQTNQLHYSRSRTTYHITTSYTLCTTNKIYYHKITVKLITFYMQFGKCFSCCCLAIHSKYKNT